jgi:hypothetical protein
MRCDGCLCGNEIEDHFGRDISVANVLENVFEDVKRPERGDGVMTTQSFAESRVVLRIRRSWSWFFCQPFTPLIVSMLELSNFRRFRDFLPGST